MIMKEYIFEYDQEADAAYIKVKKGAKVYETAEIEDNVLADLDKNKKLIGIEILNFSKVNFKLGKLVKEFENVVLVS